MAGLPNVKISLLNNQLGRVAASADGLAGLIMSGVAVATKIALLEPKQIFTLADAVALGLDATYDTTNSTDVYRQISEFYAQAGNGAELWIMLCVNTMTMTDICDKTMNNARRILDAAAGRIRLLGITRSPSVGYTPVVTDGIDGDVRTAAMKLQALGDEYAGLYKPFRAIIAARAFTGVPANLFDFRTLSLNRVGVVLATTKATSKNPAVGLVLGRFAKNPVQQKISRVKDGDMGILQGYMSDGATVETVESAWDSIHDKGYTFFRKFANKSGYFINDDASASLLTDDYSSLARGRVIDKAMVIAYRTFVEEIADDLEIDQDGYMSAAVVKSYQAKIENAINNEMRAAGEISSVLCEIDPKQNLLSTDTVKITKLGVIPKGYASYIDVPLGFTNPLNQ